MMSDYRKSIFILSIFLVALIERSNTQGNNGAYPTPLFKMYYDIDNITFTEEDVIAINFTLHYNSPQLVIAPVVGRVLYDKVARVMNCSYDNDSISSKIQVSDNRIISGKCHIKALRLGKTFFQATLNNSAFESNITSDNAVELIVLRLKGVKEIIFRVVTIALVIWVTFLMGCGLNPFIIRDYLKRPIAPAIGFVSQFIFMPCLAFGIAKIAKLENSFGFGLLTIGCSPGGGGSNVWTVLLRGELNLSMTMTFISTVFSLGMMPLWIFVFGRYFLDTSEVKIPYEMIAANLLQIVLPCCAGMILRWKKENIAEKLTKLVRIFAPIFIIWVMSFGIYANFYIFQLIGDYAYLLPIGASLPYFGFILGFITALVCKRTKKECITIALETGIQNIGIPILILLYSMPAPQGPLGATMPIIVAIFTPMPLYILFIVLLIVRKCRKKLNDENVEDKDEEKGENNKESKSFIKKKSKSSKQKSSKDKPNATDYELEST